MEVFVVRWDYYTSIMTENSQKKYHFAKVLLPKPNDAYLCSSNFKKSEVHDVYMYT